jgi:Tfp pilus assembly protein PilO
MASSGAMADFARLPTNRKILIFVGIGGALLFFYHRFIYKGLAEARDKAEKTYNSVAQQNKQLEDDIPRFTELRKKKGDLDAQFIAMQKALPTEAEVPAFFETIENKLTDAGIDDMKFSKKNEEPFDQFVKVPLNVEITGSFMQIKRFFASLIEKKRVDEQGRQVRDRIVSIENLSLTNPTMRNRELVLTAKFTAVTFRQQSAAPLPQTAPGQVPSDAPAPTKASGGAGNAPPLPTPGEAKSRVEDAMKKSEQRVEDAMKKSEQRVEDKTKDEGSARLKGGL